MFSTEIITGPPDWDFAYFEKVTKSLTAIASESVYSSQLTNLEFGRLYQSEKIPPSEWYVSVRGT